MSPVGKAHGHGAAVGARLQLQAGGGLRGPGRGSQRPWTWETQLEMGISASFGQHLGSGDLGPERQKARTPEELEWGLPGSESRADPLCGPPPPPPPPVTRQARPPELAGPGAERPDALWERGSPTLSRSLNSPAPPPPAPPNLQCVLWVRLWGGGWLSDLHPHLWGRAGTEGRAGAAPHPGRQQPGLFSGGRRMVPQAPVRGFAEGFWGDNWATIKCSLSKQPGCRLSPVTAGPAGTASGPVLPGSA